MPMPRIARVPAMRPSSGRLTVVFRSECVICSRFHMAFLVLAAFLASSRSILGPLVLTAFTAA
jgi:hypothetical protein